MSAPTQTDPTFYRTPSDAISAPPETLAYVVSFDPEARRPDALNVVDVNPSSSSYGKVLGYAEMPGAGDELHHFGWNACSSALCHTGEHGHHGPLQRRYLLVPGLRSSRLHIFDTQPDPMKPQLVKTLEPAELAKAGYSRPHTLHCGPDGLYISCLGGANGSDGPGGIALLNHDTFEVIGPWEQDRGSQYLAYDLWWHLNQNVMITSEWGTPSMIEDGVNPELLMGRKYGHSIHFWDLAEGRHVQEVDLGDANQWVLELRPSHDPEQTWGFVNAATNVEDLSANIFRWYRDGDRWAAEKVITIPAEPADASQLPPMLQAFGAVPPLVTDIDLTVDDRWLYVSCWGTGELRQYDVSDPANPRHTDTVQLGGIVRRAPHPSNPDRPLNGAPQMVEVSRDGRRIYFTNSLYKSWDAQVYPDGIASWMAKVEADPERGGMRIDESFFPQGEDFRGQRAHQIRLQGGDASSDSYCFR